MKISLLFLVLVIIISQSFASAFLISDQGTNVREIATGNLTVLANLTISLYDDPTAGNLIFEQDLTDIIANGSWNVMINPNMEYGKNYYKDYQINGEDLDFDGNERLQFQSSVGKINNISFINFSLINSCSAGSSIRVIYENGSVECETDDSSGTSDLTNYALKNQSETFEGNITTSQTGLFGWLGSLASRITKLFVQDIDVSGNINVTGNVTAGYFIGDGSLLTGLSAGTESDPIFITENSTLWNAINSKLDAIDQRYNETTLIVSLNKTSNIMSLNFYNKTEVDSLISGISGGNSSFNQSLTDIIYYSISNPLNFINNTQVSVYNETSLILTTNSSLWDYIEFNDDLWLSTYNETYALNMANNSFNQSLTNTLYAPNTTAGIQALINSTGIYSTYNSTYAVSVSNNTWNQTLADTLYAAITWNYNQTAPAFAYTDAVIVANSSAWLSIYNASYESTYNETYHASIANNTWNQTLADTLYAAISSFGTWGQNKTKIHYSNITGTNSATDCSGTDKVVDVTITEGIISTTCEPDISGTGSSITYYLSEDITTSSTSWLASREILTMPISARTNYTIICELIGATSSSSVGVQTNITTPSGPLYFFGSWLAPTSATASFFATCSGAITSCVQSQTAALTSGSPIKFSGRFENGENAGNLILRLKAETTGTARIKRGSYCILAGG